nr:gas vesicle accessory protein GvpU [uncultured Halomonas sp.]
MHSQLENNDILLSALVGMAESGASMGVTLYVNGVVITGELISQKRYVEEIVSDFRGPMEDAFKEHSSSILESISRVGDMPNGSRGEEGEASEYEFVHLSGAQYFSGNNGLPSNGKPWRGKLAAIDGFMLGRMSVSQN